MSSIKIPILYSLVSLNRRFLFERNNKTELANAELKYSWTYYYNHNVY